MKTVLLELCLFIVLFSWIFFNHLYDQNKLLLVLCFCLLRRNVVVFLFMKYKHDHQYLIVSLTL